MIRPAEMGEISRILEIYERGREFMRCHGNPTQWGENYPPEDVVRDDILRSQLYVICGEDELPHGVFAFLREGEPDYEKIDGAWLWDGPYGTIHRVASDGSVRGVLGQAVEFACRYFRCIRIDTHEDNIPMQGAILKAGFKFCGTVHLKSGDPRWAYEKIL